MEKEFVLYEQALALRELGLDNPCLGFFDINQGLTLGQKPEYLASNVKVDYIFGNSNYPGKLVLAPTYSQAFRWFRKEHKMKFNIIEDSWNDWCTIKIQLKSEMELWTDISIKGYEEAELECLKKLIELVKG